MKAACLESGQLEIKDQPTPAPGHEQALIRIHSAGVCHSDLHIVRGDWAGVPDTGPLGHEAIGEVIALGAGAERFIAVGDRVILGLGGSGGGYWCGACEYCMRGEPRHCAQTQGIMGTFAEEFCVYAKSLVKLPDNDGRRGGAPGLRRAHRLRRGEEALQAPHPARAAPMAIVGAAGGLGHYAVQIAKAFGYKVVGIDVGADKLEFVKSLGADYALSPDEAPEVVMNELGGVDASIAFTAKIVGFKLGLQLLKRGGLFVAVGLPATSEGNLELNPFEFFYKDPTLIYSAVGNVQDMRELVDMAAAGQVRSHIGPDGAALRAPRRLRRTRSGRLRRARRHHGSRNLDPVHGHARRRPVDGIGPTGPFVDGRVRATGLAVPAMGRTRRAGGPRAIPPLRERGLPVGVPHDPVPRAEGARRRDRDVGRGARHASGRLDLRRDAGVDSRRDSLA